MKKITLVLLVLFSCNAHSQSADSLLKVKVEKINVPFIQKLAENGVITQSEAPILGAYTVRLMMDEKGIDSLTCERLIDRFRTFMKLTEAETAKMNNFGSDSVFIRTVDGKKLLLGMGKLSLEKLVARASMDLPRKYKDQQLRKPFGSLTELPIIVAWLKLDDMDAALIGSTFFIMRENGVDVNSWPVGYLIEIAKRIKHSKEFEPFLSF